MVELVVRNSFRLTTIRGLYDVVDRGLAVVVVVVVVVGDRMAGRVRFLKKGTVDWVIGVVFGTSDDGVVVLVYLKVGRVRSNLT